MKISRFLISAGITATLIVAVFQAERGNSVTIERMKAPEFPSGAHWIGVERPLTMHDLRGRVVLLDFWTYCCINCMHVLPDLARLEMKYGDRLAVIGVHSAKFQGERDTGNIMSAVKRYGIRHPVLNDAGFVLWNEYGIHSWPTMVIIDRAGKVAGQVSGEGNFEVLDRAISGLLSEKDAAYAFPAPLPILRNDDDDSDSALRFPGKILADSANGRLYVADSGHNRIVVTDIASGDIVTIIGSGKAGLADGGYHNATFSNPQGMTMAGAILYVADTDNHALRAVHLDRGTVETVAGTGRQSRWGATGGQSRTTSLNSPWDVTILDGRVYIAMAGSHQIWRYDPGRNTVEVYAGSGREDIADGMLERASLAQPSGISAGNGRLYFADSETSSIRVADTGGVRTLMGTGLFDFGWRDGRFSGALLQHPLGVVYDGGMLWIADTYNNRLRRADPARGVIETMAGSDPDGLSDGPGDRALFDEPGGLSVAGGKVYVADTNNHAIRIYDIASGKVATLDIVETAGMPAPGEPLRAIVTAPPGYHLTEGAPSNIEAFIRPKGASLERTVRADSLGLAADFRLPDGSNGKKIEFKGELYLCTDRDKGICTMRSFRFVRRLREGGRPDITHTVHDPLTIKEE